jgi:hypothetical protein
MAKPKEVLSPEDYNNYQRVSAAAVLLVVLGIFFLYTAISTAMQRDEHAIGFSIVGLAGVVGGIAALRGNRRWAKLAYVIAVPYLMCFPIGTIISYIMLRGLSRYLESKERVRKATTGTVKSDFADL